MKQLIWRALGGLMIYAAVVVAFATMAQPAKPGDIFDMSRSFEPILNALPGSRIALALIDFNANVWGLPIPIVVIGVLILAALGGAQAC